MGSRVIKVRFYIIVYIFLRNKRIWHRNISHNDISDVIEIVIDSIYRLSSNCRIIAVQIISILALIIIIKKNLV